jgi:hypothetical protein
MALGNKPLSNAHRSCISRRLNFDAADSADAASISGIGGRRLALGAEAASQFAKSFHFIPGGEARPDAFKRSSHISAVFQSVMTLPLLAGYYEMLEYSAISSLGQTPSTSLGLSLATPSALHTLVGFGAEPAGATEVGCCLGEGAAALDTLRGLGTESA